MKQKNCCCLRSKITPAARCLTMICLIMVYSICFHLRANAFPLGKHDEKIETWSFHSKIDLPEKDRALYVGMFFCAGSLYFLKGNFAHIFWLDTSTGEYVYENNIFLPPFEKVVHSHNGLNEKFDDSFFRYHDGQKNFLVYTRFDDFCAKMTLFSEKDPLCFDYVNPEKTTAKTYDWYMYPRMNIHACLEGEYGLDASGQGHFQHYWGEKVYDSGDYLVAHLDSGYDIVINDITVSGDEKPLLPIEYEYLLISDPDGSVEKVSSFDYVVHEWAKSGHKGKKYPVHVSVKSEEKNLELDICVFKKDQTANLMGVEKWFGYASVKGHIDNQPQQGWAFFSPVGEKR